jgi:hypothetical protein
MKDSIVRICVTLLDVDPAIWRRIEVPANCTLERLHDVLQIILGWADYHLHHFQIGSLMYGEPTPEDRDVLDGRKLKLSSLAIDGERAFEYVYDYGDNWRCVVVLEAIAPSDRGRHLSTARGRRSTRPSRGGRWSVGLYRVHRGHCEPQARTSQRTARMDRPGLRPWPLPYR